MKCWGYNNNGEVMPVFFLYYICDFFQIGDGSNTNRNAPVAVSGLSSGVIVLALGEVSSSDRGSVPDADCSIRKNRDDVSTYV